MRYEGTSTVLEVEACDSIMQSKFVFSRMRGRKQVIEIFHASIIDRFPPPAFAGSLRV